MRVSDRAVSHDAVEGRAVVAVIGGAGAIGRAIAAELASEARLIVIDRDAAGVERAVSELGGDAVGHVVDVAADEDATVELLAGQASENRQLGVVVCVGTTMSGSIAELSLQDWRACLDSCLTSVYMSLKAAVLALRETGGAICVIGSVHADSPQPGYAAYAAAKAGVHALARQVAAEYGHLGIRVNLVTPGWTQAPHTLARADDRDAIRSATPLRTLTGPNDIAAAVRFLMSDAARQISGSEIVVDGGARLFGADTVLREQYRSRIGLT